MAGEAAVRASGADETLARAQAGEAAAFAEIVRTHQGMVYGLALHFLREPSLAEELAQDVFFELFRSLARMASADHVAFWLRRVTGHRCIDRARRGGRAVPLDEIEEPRIEPAPADPLLSARLRQLVGELPARARMVVILRYQEDLAPSEIGAILAMPVNTVKSHLRRSMAVLRGKLGPGGDGA